MAPGPAETRKSDGSGEEGGGQKRPTKRKKRVQASVCPLCRCAAVEE
jgi:hypothetical protein